MIFYEKNVKSSVHARLQVRTIFYESVTRFSTPFVIFGQLTLRTIPGPLINKQTIKKTKNGFFGEIVLIL